MISQGQLGIAGLHGLGGSHYSCFSSFQRGFRVCHGIGCLANQVGIIDALCCRLLLPCRAEDVFVFLHRLILETQPFLQQRHFCSQTFCTAVRILKISREQFERSVSGLHLLADADEGILRRLYGLARSVPVGLGQFQRLVGALNVCFGLLDGCGGFVQV